MEGQSRYIACLLRLFLRADVHLSLFFLLSRAESCQGCPVGTAQPIIGQSSCPVCGPGFYSDSPNLSQCRDCVAGRFTALYNQTQCALCPTGTHQASARQQSCDDCLPGEYQDSAGQALCVQCPSGQYGDQPAQSTCLPCPVGTFNVTRGATVCGLCTIGRYSNATGPCTGTLAAECFSRAQQLILMFLYVFSRQSPLRRVQSGYQPGQAGFALLQPVRRWSLYGAQRRGVLRAVPDGSILSGTRCDRMRCVQRRLVPVATRTDSVHTVLPRSVDGAHTSSVRHLIFFHPSDPLRSRSSRLSRYLPAV
jgi:hypothetical protein